MSHQHRSLCGQWFLNPNYIQPSPCLGAVTYPWMLPGNSTWLNLNGFLPLCHQEYKQIHMYRSLLRAFWDGTHGLNQGQPG